MRIVHINEHLARKGGVETYLFSLLPLLEEAGHSSHFLYGAGDPALWADSSPVEDIGIASFSRDRTAEAEVLAVLEKQQPDVVHLHNFQNIGVLRACLQYGRTVMTTHDYRSVCPANSFFFKRTQQVCTRPGAGLPCFVHGVVHRCLTPRPRYAAYFYRRALEARAKASDLSRIIAPSRGARGYLNQARVKSDNVTILPYFCPIEPRDAPRPIPERPRVTFLGRIAPNKGHEYFIEALGMLPHDVEGLLVGNLGVGGIDHVRGIAARNGCADRLRIQQWASREEVLALLDETSVLVFPSLWPETLGIVGIEAMSRGVPVVASDIGGVTEWLEDGANGHLVPPKSASAITRAVLALLDPDRQNSFGMAAIETVRNRFTPASHVEALVKIYRAARG